MYHHQFLLSKHQNPEDLNVITSSMALEVNETLGCQQFHSRVNSSIGRLSIFVSPKCNHPKPRSPVVQITMSVSGGEIETIESLQKHNRKRKWLVALLGTKLKAFGTMEHSLSNCAGTNLRNISL
jgi:hypothetical protein